MDNNIPGKHIFLGNNSEVTVPSEVCCETMRLHVTNRCEKHKANPWMCPEMVVVYLEKEKHYGIPIGIGSRNYVEFFYCPWCGKKLAN